MSKKFPTADPRERHPGLFQTFSIVVATGLSCCASNANGQTADVEYSAAAAQYERGEWETAIRSFNAILRQYPNTDQSVTAHFFLGEAHLQQANFERSFQAFQTYLRNAPNGQYAPRATFRLGESAYRLNRFGQAIRLLESFALDHKHDPLNEFGLAYLGEMRLQRGDAQLAQRAFETCLDAYPQGQLAGKCRLGLARALSMLGQADQAQRYLRSVANNSKSVLRGDAQLQLGMLSFAERDFIQAREQFGVAVAVCETNRSISEANYWLAKTELKLGNGSRAIVLFDQAIQRAQDPELASAILMEGAVAAAGVGDDRQALAWLDALDRNQADRNGSEEALKLRIDIAYRQNQFDAVAELTDRLIKNFPYSPHINSAHEIAGQIAYEAGDFKAAMIRFKKILGSEKTGTVPDQELRNKSKYMLGLCCLGREDYARAIDHFDSVSMDIEQSELRSLVEIARGSTLSALGEYRSAVTAYRNYLAIDPQGDEAHRARAELCVALANSGYWADAQIAFGVLERSQAERPLVIQTARFLAENAFEENELDLAQRCYQVMAARGDKEAKAQGLSGLAWVQLRSDDTEAAYATFETLLKEHPNSKFAAEAAMARAKYLGENDEFQRSADMYDLVIRRFPDSQFTVTAKLRKGLALQQLGGEPNLRQAKELLTDYIQSRDTSARDEAIYQLGWLFHDLDLAHHGRERFQLIFDEYRGSKYWPDAAYRLASYHVEQRDFDAATPILDQLISEATPYEVLSRVVYLKGQIAAELNDWTTVSSTMEDLIERTDDPKLKLQARYWKAESLYRQKKYELARPEFETLVLEGARLPESIAPWVQLRTAQCAGKKNDWQRALSVATDAAKDFPRFDSAHEYEFIRGRALANLGRLDEARTAFLRVIKSKSGGQSETAAIAQWRIGEAYFHQEKYVEAIGAYHRLDTNFNYPKWRAAALIQAGKCQEHLGNWRHAKKLYSLLIKNFPNSEFRHEASKRLGIVDRNAMKNQKTVR